MRIDMIRENKKGKLIIMTNSNDQKGGNLGNVVREL